MTVPLIDSDQQIRSLLDTGVSMLEVSRQLGAAPKRISRIAQNMQPTAFEQRDEIVRRYMAGTSRVTITREMRLPGKDVLAVLVANVPRDLTRREMTAGMIRRKVIDYLGVPHQVVDAVLAEIDPPAERITLIADGTRQLRVYTTSDTKVLSEARTIMRGMLAIAAARAERAGALGAVRTWTEQVEA
jgi:hypothetical protein